MEQTRRAGNPDVRTVLLAVGAWSCVLAPALMLAGIASPVRVVAALVLFGLGPGIAALPLIAPRASRIELAIVLGTSLGITAVMAQGMLWLGVWSPRAGTCVLASLCLASIAPQLALRLRAGAR